MNIREATKIIGTDLGIASKLPGRSFGLPAQDCIVGSKLRSVPNSVCSRCYALRGNYVYGGPQLGMRRRLANLNHPLWVQAMVDLIRIRTRKSTKYFRWHDSGDLQSIQHLENIAEVARQVPDTHFWLPTREYGIVKDWVLSGGVRPQNLVIRLSAHIINGPTPDKLAKELGVLVSGVHIKGTPVSRECKAYTRNNKCGSCRICWNPAIKSISYKLH